MEGTRAAAKPFLYKWTAKEFDNKMEAGKVYDLKTLKLVQKYDALNKAMLPG